MVRQEYWDRAKELVGFCTEDELKVLGQQANKELERRMERYLGKFDKAEEERNLRQKQKNRDFQRKHTRGL